MQQNKLSVIRVFRKFDIDDNGIITMKEFKKFITNMEIDIEEE